MEAMGQMVIRTDSHPTDIPFGLEDLDIADDPLKCRWVALFCSSNLRVHNAKIAISIWTVMAPVFNNSAYIPVTPVFYRG